MKDHVFYIRFLYSVNSIPNETTLQKRIINENILKNTK